MKLPIYEFSKEVPQELQEAIEDVRQLLNNGKYTPRISTTEPTWTGAIGEFVVYYAGPTNVYLFVYTSVGWFYSAMTAGPLP